MSWEKEILVGEVNFSFVNHLVDLRMYGRCFRLYSGKYIIKARVNICPYLDIRV